MPNKNDRRRLADGAKARALPEPKTLKEMQEQVGTIFDGMLALQSTDDLGSPEANNQAWADMIELQKRYDTLKAKIESLEGKNGNSRKNS